MDSLHDPIQGVWLLSSLPFLIIAKAVYDIVWNDNEACGTLCPGLPNYTNISLILITLKFGTIWIIIALYDSGFHSPRRFQRLGTIVTSQQNARLTLLGLLLVVINAADKMSSLISDLALVHSSVILDPSDHLLILHSLTKIAGEGKGQAFEDLLAWLLSFRFVDFDGAWGDLPGSDFDGCSGGLSGRHLDGRLGFVEYGD